MSTCCMPIRGPGDSTVASTSLQLSICAAVAEAVHASLQVMRAAQEVAAGVQLTISYLGRSLTSPMAKRQAELQEVYGFTCSCSR